MLAGQYSAGCGSNHPYCDGYHTRERATGLVSVEKELLGSGFTGVLQCARKTRTVSQPDCHHHRGRPCWAGSSIRTAHARASVLLSAIGPNNRAKLPQRNMSTPRLNRPLKRSEAPALVPWISARVLASISVKQLLLQDQEYLASVAAVGLVMTESLSRGGRVFFCGNGGSAADAQHLAAELTGRFLKERPGIAGLALTTNTSTLTAIANDYSFDEVFSRQVEGLAHAGDVLLGISTSGNSANVVRAIKVARRMKVSTVALTGKSGGRLATAAEHCIRIPSDETPRIQEAHILTGHILAEIVEEEMFGG
jgi:D-sedoheptulose 7-phosphate isomerase